MCVEDFEIKSKFLEKINDFREKSLILERKFINLLDVNRLPGCQPVDIQENQ